MYDIKYNRRKALELGNINEGDGIKFKGRDFVQITGRNNYKKFTNILNVNLEYVPNLALNWNIAYSIAIIGIVNGSFTGYKLTDFINSDKIDFLVQEK